MGAVQVVRSLAEIEQMVQKYVGQNLSPNSVGVYTLACRNFMQWCEQHGLDPLPANPATLCLYLAHMAEKYKASTIRIYMIGIGAMHRMAGVPHADNPVNDERVRAVMRGIRRTIGTATEQVTPAMTEQIKAMVAALPDTLRGKRDRAILLFGFTTAMRHGELRAVAAEDLLFTANGVAVTIRRGKTDQEQRGRQVGVPYGSNPETCAVTAMRDWMAAAGITKGPVFRTIRQADTISPHAMSERSMSNVVKEAAARAGLEGRFSSLSLRSGFATSAIMAGEDPANVMRQTGHKHFASLQQYIRYVDVFRHNPARNLGL